MTYYQKQRQSALRKCVDGYVICGWCRREYDEFLVETYKSICPACRERYYRNPPFVPIDISLCRLLDWHYGIKINIHEDADWSPYVIYVAETLNHRKIKIGYTRRPDWRLKNLAFDYGVICKYVAYFPGGLTRADTESLEQQVLTKFADYKTTMPGKTYGKEWFINKGKLNRFVAHLRTFVKRHP